MINTLNILLKKYKEKTALMEQLEKAFVFESGYRKGIEFSPGIKLFAKIYGEESLWQINFMAQDGELNIMQLDKDTVLFESYFAGELEIERVVNLRQVKDLKDLKFALIENSFLNSLISIENGNIDPKKLIEALNKVSKVPGVSIDKVKLQIEVEKANLGKTLDTVANQTGFKNFDDLINALPENQTKGQSAQQVIEAVIDSGITANQPYSKLQPPNFEQALNRRLDKTGSSFNTAA